MFYSGINADFAAYEPKFAFGLTKRQIICFILAAAVGVPLYFLLKKYIGIDIASIIMIMVMAPFFVFALYNKNGQKLETVLGNYIKEQYINNRVRTVTDTITAKEKHKSSDKKRLKGSGPKTAADSIPFERIYENGLCQIKKNEYSIAFKFEDTNYHQLDDIDQKDLWSNYCMFLNTFSYEVKYQLCFYNSRADVEKLFDRVKISLDGIGHDDFLEVAGELNETFKKDIAAGNKGLNKQMYLLVTFNSPAKKAMAKASELAERLSIDLYDKLGVRSSLLGGRERLGILYSMLNMQDGSDVSFDFKGDVKKELTDHPFLFGKKADEFYIGKKHCCVSFLKLDASQISDRFLCKFLDMDCESILSIHIEPVDRQKAIKDVKRLVSDLQKSVIDEQKAASNRGYSMSNVSAPLKADLEAALKTLEGLTLNDEKMFMAVITLVLSQDSEAKLERNFSLAKSVANEESCELIKLEHMQEDGFFSSLPIGVNRVNLRRQLTTTSLGMLLPFKIKELFQTDEALWFGSNKITGNIIMANIKTLNNPNTLILGTPGRGKSVSIKLLILQIFFKLRDDIIISDPEGEYGMLVRFVKGIVIVLSQAGKNYINLFDISPDCDWESDPISDKSQLMMSIFELILGPGKGEPNDKSIIDRVIRKIYKKFLITKNTDDLPILEDFYNELKKQEGKRAQFLCEAMEVYVHGGLNFFNHRTNVDMNNRVICFDIKQLGEQLKPLAMLIVQETVWSRVSKNRANKKYTWYVSDEFHLLLKDPQTAQYSKEIYKRFRKWGGIPVAITQNVSDLLDSSQAQSIFYNSDCYILLGQATGDADRLCDALKLSREQYKCILTRNKGEGLLIFGDTVIPFVNRVDSDSKVYKLITTKLIEVEE